MNNENIVTLPDGEEFVVDLMSIEENNRSFLGREAVRRSDLSLVRDETWREGVRKGALTAHEPSLFSMRVLLGDRDDDGVAGYRLELAHNGEQYRQWFSVHSLASVARRQLAKLLKQESVDEDVKCGYRLNGVPSLEPASTDETAQEGNGIIPAEKLAKRVTRRTAPIVFEEASLAEFIRRSEVMSRPDGSTEDETGDPPMPVFISHDVWVQGHQLARRGGECESAAVLTGRLMRDVDSPEIFMLIDACIEAEHAEESQVSVTFTGDTWARVRDVLEQRRKRLNRPHERIVGSVHGHNFSPGKDEEGDNTCNECPKQSTCERTTAVASSADVTWFQCIHSGHPWSLLLIHGRTAKSTEDWRLYHLADGSLVPRNIRRLKD